MATTSEQQPSKVAAQELLAEVRAQLELLKTATGGKADAGQLRAQLARENADLRAEADRLRDQLARLQMRNGVTLAPLLAPAPAPAAAAGGGGGGGAASSSSKEAKPNNKAATKPKEAKPTKQQAKPKDATKPAGEAAAAGASAAPALDVTRLDLRIGRIVAAEKHPDADSLYVETVEVGEPRPRTIVSGLAAHVPLAELQGRLAVFLLNLKPAKMRGIASEGMIMCATADGRVEPLAPPAGVQPGDRVVVEGCPADSPPPDAQLNPKKKIWESLKPHCLVDAAGRAGFKGASWLVPGKGEVRAPTLKTAQIS